MIHLIIDGETIPSPDSSSTAPKLTESFRSWRLGSLGITMEMAADEVVEGDLQALPFITLGWRGGKEQMIELKFGCVYGGTSMFRP